MRNFFKQSIMTLSIGVIFLTSASLSEGQQRQIRETSSPWIKTEAQIKLIPENIKNLKINNTVFGQLVRQTTSSTGKKLKDLLEKDGSTILSFEIHYWAPVEFKDEPHPKNIKIIQYGLFRALNPTLQLRILESKTRFLNIRYKSDDPMFIEFFMDSYTLGAPPLFGNVIDRHWIPQ